MTNRAINTIVLSAMLCTILHMATLHASSEVKEKIHIGGTIRTKDGSPVKDIRVMCWYLHRNFPWEFGRQASDDQGRYDFKVPVGLTY